MENMAICRKKLKKSILEYKLASLTIAGFRR